MARFGWMVRWMLLSLIGGCSAPVDPSESQAVRVEPEPTAPAKPPKADPARPAAPPAPGIACGWPGERTCDRDAGPLRCVAGSGGAVWMTADACTLGHRCVMNHGCLPLPECTDVGLIGCVHQALFVCEAANEGRAWIQATQCPASIPCVNGRGCPNPFGVATPCSFVDPPRCTPDGQVMRCSLEGIEAIWGAPEDCGAGTRCVGRQGCQAPEAHEPDTPTNPPKGRQRGWR